MLLAGCWFVFMTQRGREKVERKWSRWLRCSIRAAGYLWLQNNGVELEGWEGEAEVLRDEEEGQEGPVASCFMTIMTNDPLCGFRLARTLREMDDMPESCLSV